MERIKLNLIPSGVAPIVHLSQYDDGRQFGIDLFEGESVYVLDGTETLTVNSRKPDGHVVTLTVTNTGTSSLDVDTVEQLTAVHGLSYAKLKIEKGSVTIATLPFLIDVSRDPLENGDPSESFVDNLQTQIALAVADQYDSANVIFDNAPTSGHGNGYAVTSEGVKTAVDNLNTALAGKVNTSDFLATNLPIESGSATNTKDYIDTGLIGKAPKTSIVWEGNIYQQNDTATISNFDNKKMYVVECIGFTGGNWHNFTLCYGGHDYWQVSFWGDNTQYCRYRLYVNSGTGVVTISEALNSASNTAIVKIFSLG